MSRRSREEGRNGFNEGVKLNSASFLGFLLLYDMFLFYLQKYQQFIYKFSCPSITACHCFAKIDQWILSKQCRNEGSHNHIKTKMKPIDVSPHFQSGHNTFCSPREPVQLHFSRTENISTYNLVSSESYHFIVFAFLMLADIVEWLLCCFCRHIVKLCYFKLHVSRVHYFDLIYTNAKASASYTVVYASFSKYF